MELTDKLSKLTNTQLSELLTLHEQASTSKDTKASLIDRVVEFISVENIEAFLLPAEEAPVKEAPVRYKVCVIGCSLTSNRVAGYGEIIEASEMVEDNISILLDAGKIEKL